MSISYVTGAQATGTSAGNVSCAVGDLILVFAYRDGSNTVPTLATGFTNLGNAGANTNSERTGWKIATSTTESTGTWANATKVVALVYRTSGYATGYSLTVGATAAGTAASTTVNYPALTLQNASGTSRVAGFAGHRSVDTNVQNAPAGMTNRQATNATTAEAAGHDTNGGVTSWSSTNVSVGGTSSGWRSRVVEIKEVPPPLAGWTVLTQGANTTSAEGQLALQAVVATTQGAATVSAAAQLAIQASHSTAQGDTTVSSAGASPINGVASTSQGASTTSASGAIALQATASSTQAGNTVSSAAHIDLRGVVLTSQEGNSLVAEGQLPIVGVAGIAQADNALSSSGTISSGNTGSLSTAQGASTVAAAGVVALQAAAATEQGAHTVQATGMAPISVALDSNQADSDLYSIAMTLSIVYVGIPRGRVVNA